jgi:hypothetical protein
MFLQVFRGDVHDPAATHGALDRLMDTLDGTTDGWLGTTAGVTPDGHSLTLSRFTTAEDARRTNQGPAGHTWLAEMSGLSSVPVTVDDCPQVITQLRGDSSDAEFVQVLQGRIADLERLEHALEAASPWQTESRSDIIGGLLALHGDGRFTQAVYFTSESEARAGERVERPAEADEIDSLVSDVSYFELRQPWAYTPR